MSNSYRIRTQVGVDKSINLLIHQDFEQLEIRNIAKKRPKKPKID